MMHRCRLVILRVVGMAMLLMGISTWGILAADGPSSAGDPNTSSPATAAKPSANEQINALKQQMALQQQQIEQMQRVLEQQKQLLEQLTKPAPATGQAGPPAKPAVGTEPATQPHAASLGEVATTSPMIPPSQKKTEDAIGPAAVTSPTLRIGGSSGAAGEETSPLQLHIGDATLTPVGFMDFTSIFRTHAAGGSIGTSFGSIPYGTSYQTNLSEVRLSMQNSRIGFRTDADVKGVHVIGYMEADFLGNNGTNVAVTSNSNTLRSRLYWVDLSTTHWEVLGGQTWSLLTPGRSGISPLPADVFYTQDMDVNYQVGLFWGRIPELRIVYHPSDKAALAFAVDSPDQYAGGSSGGSTITLPSALSSTYASELDTSASSGGLGAPNVAPDFIVKLALDPSKRVHFEVGGVESTFKVWYPGAAANAATGAPAIPSQTFSSEGGGGFLNLHVEVFKGFRLMTNNFWNDGEGRYIFGQAPDVVANANGSISPLHSASTVTGFEATAKKTLLFAYYGGIYISRDTVIDTTGKPVGYGYSGASTSQNRSIQEITFGLNQTVWKNPKYGALNFISQYSYLFRDPWSVAAGAPRDATDNMLFLDLRYTLPGSAPTLGRPAR